MSYYPSVLLFVICRNIISLHKFKNSFYNLFVTFMLYKAVRLRYNAVCSSRIKPCNRITVFIIPNRKLCFISVMNRFVHPKNRLHYYRSLAFSSVFCILLFFRIFIFPIFLLCVNRNTAYSSKTVSYFLFFP